MEIPTSVHNWLFRYYKRSLNRVTDFPVVTILTEFLPRIQDMFQQEQCKTEAYIQEFYFLVSTLLALGHHKSREDLNSCRKGEAHQKLSLVDAPMRMGRPFSSSFCQGSLGLSFGIMDSVTGPWFL